jgi:L-lactate dehydrogenase complex protein LldF
MKVQSNRFIPAAQVAINDVDLQTAVSQGTNAAFHKRQASMFAYGHEHGQRLRQQAAAIKRHTLNHLPDLLEQAEANMQANGIQVLWAVDAAEANRHVLDIARRHAVAAVVKAKSMVTEEIGLNQALEAAGMDVLETDLGEYIVQLGGETPSHIVAPIVHKTKATIRDLLIEKANMPPTDDVNEMTRFARETLRHRFLTADMGVSGGNFIVAETGSIGLVSNEGNIRLATSLPRVHVALVGIEKIAPTVADYALLTQALPRSATGQALTVYTHMVNGPRQPDETDGPEHVYVILVDNGRSQIYNSDYCEALACIRCGACLNGCPVYQAAGGHAYGWVYSGPIGAVITPLLTGLENASPLPHASTLCGMCKEVCPVDIDIPRMLLDLRHELVQQGQSDTVWNLGMRAWAFGSRSPGRFSLGSKLAAKLSRWFKPQSLPGPLRGWTQARSAPRFAPKSFRQLWQEREKGGDNEQS